MPPAPADFTAAAVDYIRRGWNVIPLAKPKAGNPKSGKAPAIKGWLSLRWTEAEAVAHWTCPGVGNIGILTGTASGIVVLDFDAPEVYRRWELDHPEAVNTYTVARTNAEPGRRHLYFRIEEGQAAPPHASEAKRWDLQSTDQQVVAPPSIHYSGGTYRVVLDVPLLPWQTAYMPPRSEPAAKPAPEPAKAPVTDAARISQALAYCDPNCCRAEWIAVGMALHAWSPTAGLALWDRWSRDSSKYQDGETATVWKGFKTGGGIGIGTLFTIAQRYGYKHRGKAPKFQYGRLPADIVRSGQCRGMSAADLAVLMTASVTMNEQTGSCRIQHKTIAGYFGIDDSTVKHAVARLVERGLLLRTRTGKANVYRWGILEADRAPAPHHGPRASDRAFGPLSDRAPTPHPQNNAHAREDVPVRGALPPFPALPPLPVGDGVADAQADTGLLRVYNRPDRA